MFGNRAAKELAANIILLLAVVCGLLIPYQITAQTGPIAYWPMEEGQGTSTSDVAGGNTATLVNGPLWSTDGGIEFDGSDDHLSIDNFDVSGTGLTLAARFRAHNLSNCVARDCRILSKALGTASEDHYLMVSTIKSKATTRLRFRLKTDGATETLIGTSGQISENQWYHVAAVYDGAEMRLYQDGVLVGTLAKTGSITPNPSAPVWIGGNPPVATSRPWDGEIDEVRIYDRALNSDEILALVSGFNQSPQAVDDPDAATTTENIPVNTINVLANDTLVDNAILSAFDSTSVNNGTVVNNGDGTFLYSPAAGFTGSDSFTYTLTDDDGESDSATVTVTVTAANSGPPVAVDDPDAATTTENTPVTTINVLSNDTLVDNAAISSFDAVSVEGGTVISNGDGTFHYTPALGFTGSDSFTYTLEDEDQESSSATVSVNVVSSSSGLVAYWPMSEGQGTTTADATANNNTGTLINGAQWGAEGGIEFDGTNDYVEVGTIDVLGTAITLMARFRAHNLSNCVARDCRILSKALGTASDDHYLMVSTIKSKATTRLRFRLKTDGTTETLIGTSGQISENQWFHMAAVYDGAEMRLYQDGVLVGTLARTGSITPNPSALVWIGGNPPVATSRPWDGEIDEVRIYDRALNSDEILALVSGANQSPQAVDDPDAATTTENIPVNTINVLANDTLVDNAALSAFDSTSVNNGTVVNNGDGTFLYSPAAGFTGSDSFTYTLTDDDGESDSATVTVTVTNVNSGPPVAVDDPNAATTAEDTPVTTVDVLANDTLVDNAALSAFDSTSVNNGTVVNNGDGTFLYSPAAGFTGSDSFTYTLTDDDGESDSATVTVTVTATNGGPPVAVDDPNAATTAEDTPVTTVDVLANDTLVDNATFSAFDSTSVNNGTVVNNGDGTFLYSPAAGFTGSDSFTYTLTDDDGESDSATVTVTVTNVNSGPPVAVDDPNAATTAEDTPVTTVDVLANDTLVDNATLSAFDSTSVNNGTVVNNSDGTFLYSPAAGFTGSDSFTYTLTDDDGESDSATVTVMVTAANSGPPVAVDDPNAATTVEDTPVTTVDVLANDTLVDNAALSAFDSTSMNNGTVVKNGDGTFLYSPATGFTGSDSFTYTLTDDDGESDSATVTVTVTNVNSGPPVAVDDPDAATTAEDTPVTTVDVLANDTLVDNAALSAFDNTSVNNGTVVNNGDGTFLYSPAAGFTGSDSFTYTLTDDDGDSSTVTVTITVIPVNSGVSYYISPGGSDSNPGTLSAPWQTIDKANASLQPGDTVYLRDGVYNGQSISPTNSGLSDNDRITYKAFLNETPILRKIKVGIKLINKNYITIDGIDMDGEFLRINGRWPGIDGGSSNIKNFALLENASNNIIQNVNWQYAHGWGGLIIEGNSRYNKVLNSTIDYVGTYDNELGNDAGDSIQIGQGSEYNLVEGNTLAHGGHNLLELVGRYNVIKNNVFNNDWSDVFGGNKGNRSAALKGLGPSNYTAGFNVFEDNIVINTKPSIDGTSAAMKVLGEGQIVRRNFIYNHYSSGILTANGNSSNGLVLNNRIYHNVFYDLGGAAWNLSWNDNNGVLLDDNIFINNIIYKARQNPENASLDAEITFKSSTDTIRTNKIIHNLFFNSTAGDAKIYSKKDGNEPLSNFELLYPTNFYGNVQEDPLFVSTDFTTKEDFQVVSASPAVDAGAFLTKTQAAGSGQMIPVEDPYFFTDGFGIIPGDKIRVAGSTPVTILSVDYINKTIEVDASLSWSQGDGVTLNYNGQAPDIGVFENE